MELDWLETFLAVVDRGGFTAASAQVHRSVEGERAYRRPGARTRGAVDRPVPPARHVDPGRTIFAGHAREILVGVGSARSAIGVMRAMNSATLAVLTTPCIGGALFPGVIADLLARHPLARIALSERGRQGGEQRVPADGFVLAVLPTLVHPQASGLNEQVLWREPLQVLVPSDHGWPPKAGNAARRSPPISSAGSR